jgi:hypothetical protein
MQTASKSIWPKFSSIRNLSLANLVLCYFFLCHATNIGDAVCENTSASEKMSCLQDQVRSTPADARTWFDLGKFYHEVGDITKAKISYHNVIKLYPLSYLAAEAHLHQGIIHQTDGAHSSICKTEILIERIFNSSDTKALLREKIHLALDNISAFNMSDSDSSA